LEPRIAILETSHRSGWVALAQGPRLLAARQLNEARRHTRDLAPLLAELLGEQGWRARNLDGVIVSRGPGSYTGLRVGLISAKTLAYATGCALLAVDTFAAIAVQMPASVDQADVIADAQQDKLYVQRFARQPGGETWSATNELRIVAFAEWIKIRGSNAMIAGPGLEIFAARLPAELQVAQEYWLPRPESLLRLGLERLRKGQRDDPFAVEPLYLRPSSAEEKQMGER